MPGLTQAEAADRSYLNNAIFQWENGDISLLDIGNNLGCFCLEASKRGFEQAVGIDPDVDNIRKADRVAKIFKSNAKYIEGNFESYDWGERKLDVVLCLNVLHHRFDPVHAIRKMIHLAQ